MKTAIQNKSYFIYLQSLSNLRNWKLVGQLHVKLIAAKGLSGKPNAYCVLELDNERVQTPFVPGPEHLWNRTYVL